jgi:hypothetical protein
LSYVAITPFEGIDMEAIMSDETSVYNPILHLWQGILNVVFYIIFRLPYFTLGDRVLEWIVDHEPYPSILDSRYR